MHRLEFTLDNKRLADEKIEADYIALTQNPMYKADPRYSVREERVHYLAEENLQNLRPYQIKAIRALQDRVRNSSKGRKRP